MSELYKLKSELSKGIDMKDFGKGKKILSIEIKKDTKGRKLTLSQGSYAEKVLERFGMDKPKSISTSMSQHFRLYALLYPTTYK